MRETSHYERESVGFGVRQKIVPSVETPTKRRGRNNGENVAPDGATNVDMSGVKPSWTSKGSKTPVKDVAMASPALLPRFPKPSPVRNVLPTNEGQDAITPVIAGAAQEQVNGSKRKLNWDLPSGAADGVANHPSVDPSESGVKVIVRMRPLNKKEAAEEATNVVQKLSGDSLSLGDQQFTFDSVAGETESQEAVFEMVGRPMVENCLAGFNSSIFAYGQTGSGKTHTMWGILPTSGTDASVTEERGITPRVFEQLFSRIQQEERNNVEKQLRYQCRCSFLEIYNEQITDLLEPTQKNLLIREDTKTGVYVEGLTEEYVSNMDDVISLLVRGSANRRVGSTAMNNESSRSHSVFTFVIESRSKSVAEGVSSVRTSRMNLVDLAGSERQKQTGAAGDRLKEAGNINKSLSQLGNVINILAEVAQSGKHRHIPYRSSRLTFLLQESLGGNAKLAMICAISPASSCRTETLSTLRFAQRAKAIQNKAVVNEELGNDVNLLREQIRQLKDELMRMKCNSIQTEGSAGGLSSGWNARRSYNLLRLSLGQPMTIAPNEIKETDMPLEEKIGEDDSVDVSADGSSASDVEAKELSMKTELNTEETADWSSKLGSVDGSSEKEEPISESSAQPELQEPTSNLVAPTMSVSPRVKEGKKEEFGVGITFGLPKSPLGLRSSKAFSSSTDQLAASLNRGVEILENQRRQSLSRQSRRFSGMRFSFQNGESPSSPKRESPVRIRNNGLGNSTSVPGTGEFPCPSEHEDMVVMSHSIMLGSPSPGELSPLPEITQEDWKIAPYTPPPQTQHAQNTEALLAGALRREKIAEETIAQQAADLEQLTRLVRQYKVERECNAIIQQSREEKIARMESLVDGVLPKEDYYTDELAALQLEYKMLQEKFIHHPELAAAKAEQDLLRHELHRCKVLCDLDERENLQQDILQLRNQVHHYIEHGAPGSMKQRHPSLTSTHGARLSYSPVKAMSLTAVPETMPSCESALSMHVDDQPPASIAEEHVADILEQERRKWDEREIELVTMVQGLREECDHHMMLAEKRRKELEGEKRCTQEMHEALQMAITGHARILDQYAELQEKHILLLANIRKIRDSVVEYKKEGKSSGLICVEEQWFSIQASQIAYYKVEQERLKEHIRELQAQLDDTADAVQAAGELVVRLKESERAANLATEIAPEINSDYNACRNLNGDVEYPIAA